MFGTPKKVATKKTSQSERPRYRQQQHKRAASQHVPSIKELQQDYSVVLPAKAHSAPLLTLNNPHAPMPSAEKRASKKRAYNHQNIVDDNEQHDNNEQTVVKRLDFSSQSLQDKTMGSPNKQRKIDEPAIDSSSHKVIQQTLNGRLRATKIGSLIIDTTSDKASPPIKLPGSRHSHKSDGFDIDKTPKSSQLTPISSGRYDVDRSPDSNAHTPMEVDHTPNSQAQSPQQVSRITVAPLGADALMREQPAVAAAVVSPKSPPRRRRLSFSEAIQPDAQPIVQAAAVVAVAQQQEVQQQPQNPLLVQQKKALEELLIAKEKTLQEDRGALFFLFYSVKRTDAKAQAIKTARGELNAIQDLPALNDLVGRLLADKIITSHRSSFGLHITASDTQKELESFQRNLLPQLRR